MFMLGMYEYIYLVHMGPHRNGPCIYSIRSYYVYMTSLPVTTRVQYGTCTMWYIDVLLQYDCTTMDRNAGGRPAADRVICDVIDSRETR